ncbi:MAG: hypothetical protein SVR94_07275 [Pseudomonadota bacterium]|nr:hypothetical protein [Pseudomonadota bacterium]
MHPLTSSISLSKSALSNSLILGGWIVLWLMVFELIIYFTVPPAPVTTQGNKLQNYFEYGRSVEGKLFRMIAPTDEATAPIAQAGWLIPQKWQDRPRVPETSGGILIANYGMSFAQHVGQVLAQHAHITLRFVGGPGAPPNHTYTAFLLDQHQHQAQVVLMGIQASRVDGMLTVTSMNSAFEYPMPFTYPKYHISAQGLEALWPSVRSLTELRQVMADNTLWQNYVHQLKKVDQFYDPFLFEHNISDYSVLIRFIRRAWSKNVHERVAETIYGPQGFNEAAEAIKALKVMVVNFAQQARRQGLLPILMLFNNRGYADHLYQALAEPIREANIPTMSTHTLAPADEPRHFRADSHFTHKANKKFAQEILTLIEQHLPQFSTQQDSDNTAPSL